MRSPFNRPVIRCRVWRVLLIAATFAFFLLPASAQRSGAHAAGPGSHPGGGGPIRTAPAPAPRPPPAAHAPQTMAPTGRPDYVDRFSHGSVRHSETDVVPHFDSGHPFEGNVGVDPHHDVIAHRDFDAGFRGHHHFHDFAFHRFIPVLPVGFLTLEVGGVPYYYDDGIYYQPMAGGYQEVYPPVGAAVPGPPEGSIPVEAGGQFYYYAGGAFYLQQPDGTYQIAPTPIGVIVPELPPGAVQVALSDGSVAYHFNGVYYRPVFVNGITQYQTLMPQ